MVFPQVVPDSPLMDAASRPFPDKPAEATDDEDSIGPIFDGVSDLFENCFPGEAEDGIDLFLPPLCDDPDDDFCDFLLDALGLV